MKKVLKATLVMLLVVMFTSCGREEETTREVTEKHILTSEDIKYLPIFDEENIDELYGRYTGNVATFRKVGENSETEYYNSDGEELGKLPDDAACFWNEKNGFTKLKFIYKDELDLECQTWEIDSINKISMEILNELPEEPDWSDISAFEIWQENIGNYGAFPKEYIKDWGSYFDILDDYGDEICTVDEECAIFHNENNLVVIRKHDYTVMRDVFLLSKENSSTYGREYYLADNTPLYYLAEDGLYYYVIESDVKKTIRVTDEINCNNGKVVGIINSGGVNYPALEKTDDREVEEMFVYFPEGKIVKRARGYFYVIE